VSDVRQVSEVASTYDFAKFEVKINDGNDDFYEETARSAMPAGCDPTATAGVMPGVDRLMPIMAEHDAPPDAVRAMPCGSATKPLRVTDWLIDSGTPLDLIDKSAASRYARYVEACEPAILDTAGGEVIADKQIHLYNARLGECITPYVLESTPNVLSLGRRVVQDGYSWRWDGYTTTPVMIHPTSGEEIRLKVHDLCPYLDDAGSTFPAALCPEASSIARVSSIASVPAVRPGGYASCAAHSAAPASSSAGPYIPEPGGREAEPTTTARGDGEGHAEGHAPESSVSPAVCPDAGGSPLVDDSGEGDPPSRVAQLKDEASSIYHLLTHSP